MNRSKYLILAVSLSAAGCGASKEGKKNNSNPPESYSLDSGPSYYSETIKDSDLAQLVEEVAPGFKNTEDTSKYRSFTPDLMKQTGYLIKVSEFHNRDYSSENFLKRYPKIAEKEYCGSLGLTDSFTQSFDEPSKLSLELMADTHIKNEKTEKGSIVTAAIDKPEFSAESYSTTFLDIEYGMRSGTRFTYHLGKSGNDFLYAVRYEGSLENHFKFTKTCVYLFDLENKSYKSKCKNFKYQSSKILKEDYRASETTDSNSYKTGKIEFHRKAVLFNETFQPEVGEHRTETNIDIVEKELDKFSVVIDSSNGERLNKDEIRYKKVSAEIYWRNGPQEPAPGTCFIEKINELVK